MGGTFLTDVSHNRVHPPMTFQELTITLRHKWEMVVIQTIQNWIRSMLRQCQECCAARGGHTHYCQENVSDLRTSVTSDII